MNLVGLALRNLKRRPVRTGLSILGIGLAVGSALALITLSHSIRDSMRDSMDEIGDDLVVKDQPIRAGSDKRSDELRRVLDHEVHLERQTSPRA